MYNTVFQWSVLFVSAFPGPVLTPCQVVVSQAAIHCVGNIYICVTVIITTNSSLDTATVFWA